MKVYTVLSRLVFSLAHQIEHWVGLPKKLSRSIHFRKTWRYFVPDKQAPSPVIWIHGASVGELEDLAGFFSNESYLKSLGLGFNHLIITASSPSAANYLDQLRERYPYHYCGPIPTEDPNESSEFARVLRPDLLIMSHKDLWPILMHKVGPQLKKGVLWLPQRPVESATMIEEALLPWLRAVAVSVTPDHPTYKHFSELTDVAVHFVGPLRAERILQRIDRARSQEHPLQNFQADPKPGKINVILGSAWPEDATLFAEALTILPSSLKDRIHITIIPHEIKEPHIAAQIHHALPQATIVSQEGILCESYRGFDLVYVGGGLGRGLHNVLEPALWGLCLVSGPQIRNQAVAPDLIERGQLRLVHTPQELAGVLQGFLLPENHASWIRMSQDSAQLFRLGEGSHQRLLHLLGQLIKS